MGSMAEAVLKLMNEVNPKEVAAIISSSSNTMSSNKIRMCEDISNMGGMAQLAFSLFAFHWVNSEANMYANSSFDARNQISVEMAYALQQHGLLHLVPSPYIESVVKLMVNEHRTIKQSISGLAFTWMHYLAESKEVVSNQYMAALVQACRLVDTYGNSINQDWWYRMPLI